MARTVLSFDNEESMYDLDQLATVDPSKKVRLQALDSLNDECLMCHSELLCRMITDKSYKVRRKVIPILSHIVDDNFDFNALPNFMSIIKEYIINSINYIGDNTHKCSKICSLFPLMAEHFVKHSPPFAATLLYAYIKLLLNHIPPPIRRDGTNEKDISHMCFPDVKDTLDPNNSINLDPSSMKYKLVALLTSEWIDKSDFYIFKTMGYLSGTCVTFMDQVIPCFLQCFQNKGKSELVLLEAIKSLNKIVIDSQLRVNLVSTYPDLMQAIVSLIAYGRDNVSKQAPKLAAALGLSLAQQLKETMSDGVEELHNVKDPQYYTDVIMKNLIKNYLGDPNPIVFQVTTTLLLYDMEHALVYLNDVLNLYVKLLSHNSLETPIFKHLQAIADKYKFYLVLYLNVLEPYLVQHFQVIECIDLYIILSHSLGTNFTPVLKLYLMALGIVSRKIQMDTIEHIASLFKFIAFCIIFQNQNFGEFLTAIEAVIIELSHDVIQHVFRCISLVIQNKEGAIYAARIARLCFNYCSHKHSEYANQVLFVLVRNRIPTAQAIQRTMQGSQKFCSSFPFEQLEDNPAKLVTVMTTAVDVPPFPLPPNAQNIVFKAIPTPQSMFAANWLNTICARAIQCSPILAIRCRYPLVNQSQTFLQEIGFPAFVSCWNDIQY